MTRLKFKNLIAFLVALVLAVTALPFDSLKLNASDTIALVGKVDKTVLLNCNRFSTFLVTNDPSQFDFYGDDGVFDYEIDDNDGSDWDDDSNWIYTDYDDEVYSTLKLTVTQQYVDQNTPFAVWYKVEAADGYALPDELLGRNWIFDNFIDPEFNDMFDSLVVVDNGGNDTPEITVTDTVVDENGNPLTSLIIEQREERTLQVSSSLGELVTYQWQIFVDGEWANVNGCNSNSLRASYGLLANALDMGGNTALRCVTSNGIIENVSTELSVTVSFEPPVMHESGFEAFDYGLETALLRTANDGIMLSSDDGLLTYQIIINYLYENGDEAFEPFVATIEHGGEFEYAAESPSILGYSPFIEQDGAYVSADVINIDVINLSNDITYNVYYRPELVDYTVRHHIQHVDDDYYDYYTSTSGKQYTGYPVQDGLAIDIDGFSALYYDHLAVAADGSTVVDIYYDRNYYLMRFELNGGYGAEPIYSKYESEIIVDPPYNPGYSFVKWELVSIYDREPTDEEKSIYDINDLREITMPNSELVYRAVWEPDDTTFTVSYWLESALHTGEFEILDSQTFDCINGALIDPNQYISLPSISEDNYGGNKSEYNQALFERKNITLSHVDSPAYVESDGSTVFNVYYTRKTYTLKFYYAMSSGSGDDTTYYVIGGSTYRFGEDATISNADRGDEIKLLDHYMSGYSSQRGKVDELPTLNANGTAKNYTVDYDTSTVDGVDYKYYYISFNAKYGSDISNMWPSDVFNSVTRVGKDNTNGWSGTEAFVSAWNGEHNVYYSQHNDNQTIKGKYSKLDYQLLWDDGTIDGDPHNFGTSDTVAYLCFWENGANISWSVPKLFRYNIYVKADEGEDLAGKETREYGGDTYYLLDVYDTCDNSTVSEQTVPTIIGYNNIARDSDQNIPYDKTLYNDAHNVYFYYKKNLNELKYFSHDRIIDTKKVPFGKDLAEYEKLANEVPYPANLEPNGYYFDGWYTTPECVDGTKFNFKTEHMHDHPLKLFAKWSPKKHTIRVYLDATKTNLLSEAYIEHRYHAHAPEQSLVVNGSYRFLGWFYKDENGKEKAFVFDNIPITDSLDIYAKWGSQVPVQYTVYYKDESSGLEIAEATVGSTLAGNNKTFVAKSGTELYAGYQSGYFPVTSSHTVTMSAEGENTFTFYYVSAESVGYKVEYIDETGNELFDAKYVFNNNQVAVTEKFVIISGYMPDAYQKHLVISAEGEDTNNDGIIDTNVIRFVYKKDVQHAYYHIVHYIQNLTMDGYQEINSVEAVGIIGNQYTAEARTITGFEFDPSMTKVNGVVKNSGSTVTETLTNNGLLIEMYYNRVLVDYEVNYVDNKTGNPLKTKKESKQHYGLRATENAAVIEGYQCVSNETQTIIIAADKTQNVITFKYAEKTVNIRYVATEGGNVSINQEIVNANTGTANGSTAIAKYGYAFDGWYLDEACTVSVNDDWIENEKIVPSKEDGLYREATYYAKFVDIYADLTISKSFPIGTDYSVFGEQEFAFNIKGTGGVTADIDLTVCIGANESLTVVDLPIGEYVITEEKAWSWRYEADSNAKTVTLVSDNTQNVVNFINTMTKKKWFDFNTYKLNLFNQN